MIDAAKSIIVVSDTHFGLTKNVEREPEVFSSLIEWVKLVENGEAKPLTLGDWSADNTEFVLKPPDQMILLGDMLELWDASDRSIDVYVRTLIQNFSELKCDKIYVLGNHDNILEEIALNSDHYYALGSSRLHLLKDVYPDQTGEKGNVKVKTCKIRGSHDEYLFVHGHQFDKAFIKTGRLHTILPILREAAMAFGGFTWIFVFLFIAAIIISTASIINSSLSPFSPSTWTLVFLGVLALPRVLISWARPFYNSLKKISARALSRYERVEVDRFYTWFEYFTNNHQKEYPSKKLNVVFGHTHLIDVQHANEEVTLLNTPSWIKDLSGKEKRENVLRAAFLYIDEAGWKFFGWDWVTALPFFIPEDVIKMRREKFYISDEDLRRKLKNVGWPDTLLDEWFEILKPRMSRREIFRSEFKV